MVSATNPREEDTHMQMITDIVEIAGRRTDAAPARDVSDRLATVVAAG
jgi:hypothetical protein